MFEFKNVYQQLLL